MSEINGPNISVNSLNFNGIQKNPVPTGNIPDATEDNTPQLSDFSDNKAEALGRSMLFKGVDDVNNDLKALIENPQIAENSDEIFELAYKIAQDAGVENPYEEAVSASTVAI